MTTGEPLPYSLAYQVWRRADVLLATAAIAVLASAVPLAVRQMLDGAASGVAVGASAAAALAIGTAAGALILAHLRRVLIARAIARHVHQTDMTGVEALIARAGGRPDRRRRLARLFDGLGLQGARPWPLASALATVPDLLQAVVAALVLAALLGPPALWVAAVAGLLGLAMGGLMLAAWRARRREEAGEQRLAALQAEVLAGIVTVKALAAEEAMMRRAERLAARVAVAAARHLAWSEGVAAVAAVLPWATVVAAVLLVLPALAADTLAVGGWLAVLALAWLIGQAVAAPGAAWGPLAEAVARDRRAITARRWPAGGKAGADPVAGRLRAAIAGRLDLEAVTLRHDEIGPTVLDDVSFAVAPGEMVAISGDSGAGKSSIIALFLGLAAPAAGRVLVDGRPWAAYEPAHLLTQIGWVAQDAPLLRGSLLDNLTLFRRGAVQERALHLAHALGLQDVVRRLPYGLDTPVGSAVVQALPDGVRQRIALVRALAGEPAVVLLDDVGGALDHDGDRRLKTVLAELRGRATVVMSTHRPSLMELADRRYRLANGRLYRLADGEEAPVAPAADEGAAAGAGHPALAAGGGPALAGGGGL